MTTLQPGPATRSVLAAVAVASAPRPRSGSGSGTSPTAAIDASIVPDPADLVNAAVHEGLTGPLLWCASRGAIDLDDEQLDRLEQAHVGALAWCLRIESRLWSILEWLEPTGIQPLVVKGPAIAHLDEVDPSLRTFADLDLLVRPDDLPTVLAALARRGAVRPYAERRPGFDRRFAKSVTVTFPDRVEVDVHRTICDGVHAVRLPVERLHERPDAFELGGRLVHAPDRTARVLHASYHAVLGSASPRLLSVRDLVGYLGAAEADGTVEEIAAEAGRWGGTAVLARAVREAMLPGVELAAWQDWLGRTVSSPAEDAIVAAQRRDGSSFRASRLAAARELPAVGDRAAYLVAAAVPGTRHLRSRGRSRLDVLRSGAPTGRDPVTLPDLPPPTRHDRTTTTDERPTPSASAARLLLVDRRSDELLAAVAHPSAAVHLVVRRGGEQLRSELWRTGRPATVVELPGGSGWRRRLRRMAVAAGEVRRFDPDRIVVAGGSLPLLAPALLVGRRRTLAVTGRVPTALRLLVGRHRFETTT